MQSRRTHSQHHVREHDAGHEVNLVALDQAVCGLASHIGAGLVVRHDHFGSTATQFVALELHGQLETITNIHTQPGTGARQGTEQTDPHRFAGLRIGSQSGTGGTSYQGRAQGALKACDHGDFPFGVNDEHLTGS